MSSNGTGQWMKWINDICKLYKMIPQVTRYWWTAAVIVPLTATFGIVNFINLLLNWDLLFYNFHIWRPFTAAFCTHLEYPDLILTLLFLLYSIQLETDVFKGRPADYFYMLLVNTFFTVLVALAIGLPAYFDVLVMSLIYVWCQIDSDEIFIFCLGTYLKTSYFPWVSLAFSFIISQGVLRCVLSMYVSQLYFFLKFRYPLDFGGRALLETPRFLYQYFPNSRGSISGFGIPPSS